MKKITQKFLMALSLSVAALPVMAQVATPSSFVPVPVGEEMPLRVFVNLQGSTMFKNQVSAAKPDGQFDMMNGQLGLGAIYNVIEGFDVGFGLHGGMFSPYGYFRDAKPMIDLFKLSGNPDAKQYGLMGGVDLMVRYLGMIDEMWYVGAQAQVGYNYTDFLPGIKDYQAISTLGVGGPGGYGKSVTSFIPVVLGLVGGVTFKDVASIYLFPALEMGQQFKSGIALKDMGLWKNALGMQVTLGSTINLGEMTKLVLDLKPRMADLSDAKNTFGMDANLGVLVDF